jgi:3-methyladenine DNA glycosylase AlkD
MDCQQVIARLRAQANPKNVAGMARFGINPENTLGVSIPFLRKLAKEIGKDHALAQELWASGIHEARILAGFVDDPLQVTERQMDAWINEFDSWDVCDQVCCFLFDKTPHAYSKAAEWSSREREFEKRAAFSLMAGVAWHDTNAPDDKVAKFLPIIRREAGDERNFVKKAVSWALRTIGKRNEGLCRLATRTVEQIQADAATMKRKGDTKSAKAAQWVASDALRDWQSPATKKRFAKLK